MGDDAKRKRDEFVRRLLNGDPSDQLPDPMGRFLTDGRVVDIALWYGYGRRRRINKYAVVAFFVTLYTVALLRYLYDRRA